MRAFAIDEFGGPGAIREVEKEPPGEGQVSVRVVAASVNPVDWKAARGYLREYVEHRFPLIIGQDLSGVVEEVGAGVAGLKPGDEVFGGPGKPYFGRGTFAEFVVASPGSLAFKPDDFEHAVAASIPLAGVTGLMSVDALGEVAGKTVVVLGAAGGVGSFAVQIARARGAHVVAVARAVNHDYLRGFGVEDAVDYTGADLGERIRKEHPEVDAVIHLAGDEAELAQVARLVKDGGAVITPVGAAPLEGDRVAWTFLGAEVTGERLAWLLALVREGTLKLPPLKEFAFEQIAGALEESAAGHVRGKLGVNVSAAAPAAEAVRMDAVGEAAGA